MINNYLKNYGRINKLSIVEARAHFFMEVHENFIEAIPAEIKKYLDHAPNATEET